MDYFSERDVFKALPVKRAAYSDRTAWLLAEFSRVVYEELPQEKSVKKLITEIKELVANGRFDSEIDGLLANLVERSNGDQSNVEMILEQHDIELVDTFVKGDTEALLAKISNGNESFLVLAFRGTSSVKDAFTDIKAGLKPAIGGGLAHQGFHDGLHLVLKEIRDSLTKQGNSIPVYITGHSLGGAWAMLATKYLQDFTIGATYTYGCPRVANDQFYHGVRTPVYRVVHRADIVTRLPFGFGKRFCLNFLRLIPVNGTKQVSEWLRRKMLGYTHYGHLVYIRGELKTDSRQSTVSVKHSPNIFIVLQDLGQQIINSFFNLARDHFILNYTQKLAQRAKDRVI